MSRYRRQQTPGDNLRDLYSKLVQMVSAALGESSIDDDGALEVRVAESPVAKMGHDGTKHGLLVPNGGGWRTVQEDAQAKADAAQSAAAADATSKANAAESAANGYTDSELGAAASTWSSSFGALGSDLNDLTDEVHGARGGYSHLDGRLDSLAARISALET